MTPTQLQIIITAVNNAQAALQDAANDITGIGTAASTATPTVSELFSQLSSAASTAAVDLLPVSAAITAAAGATLVQATSIQTATAQGNSYIQSTLAQATASGQNAQQIAYLNAEIDSEQAKIATANAQLQNYSGTTAAVTARHEAAAAAIETAQLAIQTYQGQLEPLVNVTQLVGVSTASVEQQFNSLAEQSVNLGFSFEDSYVSLSKLFATFKSMPEAMSAFQAAEGLSLQAGIPLLQATQEIMQAQTTGTGRQIGQQLGISIKDGLSGTDLISAILSATSAAIPNMANTMGVQLSAALSASNEAIGTLGSTQEGPLAQILQDYTQLIEGATKWMQTHQTATTVIETGLLAVAAIIATGLGLLGFIKVVSLTYEGFIALGTVLTTSAELFGVLAAAIGLSSLALLGIVAVAILVAAAVILYHKQILEAIETCWNTVVNFLATVEVNIYQTFQTWGTNITNWWQGLWQGLLSFLQNIWGTISGVINSVLSAISKVTSSISGVFGGVTSGVSTLLTDVKAFASGGIVTSPTLALVGEAGPEAIIPLSAFSGGSSLGGGGGIGGAGNIVVNINGGSYLNQGGAQQIAQALATMIGQQLKLKIR
jgi:hypothetical protein